MAKQTSIEDQAATPGQGAEGAAANKTLTDLQKSELTEARNEALLSAQSSDPNAPSYVAPEAAEVPSWVAEVLESNQALIDSNAALTESIESFKESANSIIDKIDERVEQASEQGQVVNVATESDFDIDSEYQVSVGKSFRDPKDFAKEYTEGDNVDHLGEDVLKRLLSQGLIEEA